MRTSPVAGLVAAIATCACSNPGPTTPGGPDPNEMLQGICGYTVRRGDTAIPVAADGGPVTISVRTTAGSGLACGWSVSLNDDARAFVTLVEPASGQSSSTNATVTLAVAPNTVGERRGQITVAGVTYTITQAAAVCRLVLSGDVNRTFGPQGGSGSVTITATQGANCTWTATSSASFLRITSAASGTGTGAVSYSVEPNTGGERSATLTIGGLSVAVTQTAFVPPPPSGCVFQVAPIAVAVGFSGGSVLLVVTDEGGPACSWTVTSNSPFITVGTIIHTSDTRSEVTLAIAQNTGAARTGTVSIANTRASLSVTVNQYSGVVGTACAFSVTPTTITAQAAATTATLVVLDDGGPTCAWDVVSNASFLNVGSIIHTSDTRSEVNINIAANSGAARAGTVTVVNPRMSVTVNVTQAGS